MAAPPPPPRVLIVGAGIMGTSAAWLLSRRGLDVTVLERALPGVEASSAAAGILGAEVECDRPGPLYDLCQKSAELYPGWVRELGAASDIDVGFSSAGSLSVAFDESELNQLRDARALQIRSGRARACTTDAVSALEPELTPSVRGGVHFDSDGSITPPLLFEATHQAAERAGARFVSGVEVLALSTRAVDGGRRVSGVRVRRLSSEESELLEADVVIVAAGSWTSLIEGLPAVAARVRPARGQIVELHGERPLLGRVVFGGGVYLVPRKDGHVLIGSTLEFVGHRRGVTAGGVNALLEGALRLVPALAEASFVGAWSNFRPHTEDHLPLLGPTDVQGLILAAGHYRNGILLAPVTARVVESLVFGEPPPLELAAYSPLGRSP